MATTIITQWVNGIGEIQLALAMGLLIVMGWIGKHSVSVGYTSINMYVRDDSAPAFNYVIKVLSPVVFLIITSSLLYAFHLDFVVSNFYMVSLYYIIIQLIIVTLQGRLRLLSWKRQLLYSLSLIALSYLVYDKFISVKKNILPDFSNVANELWIIIILFIYKIINDMSFTEEASEQRKNNYQDARYKEFKAKFGRIVDKELGNDKLKAIVYAIMIHENFNRPKFVRWIETINFHLTHKPHTLGVMQVRSEEYINDKQSVVLGVRKVKKAYEIYSNKFIADEETYYHGRWSKLGWVSYRADGNDSTYVRQMRQ